MDYEAVKAFNDILALVILTISLFLGVFLLAVLIRLWDTLGNVRHTCRWFNEESETLKKRAIKRCENGENIRRIARDLKVRSACVYEWCIEVLKKRALADFESGKALSQISLGLGVSLDRIKSWIPEGGSK